MAKNVVGVFDRFLLAEDAIDELEKAGIARDNISIAGAKPTAGQSAEDSAGMVAGAGAGAAIGGVSGLIVGLGALAIPGIGAVIAAGPIAAVIGSRSLNRRGTSARPAGSPNGARRRRRRPDRSCRLRA